MKKILTLLLILINSLGVNAQVVAKSNSIVLTKVSRIGHNNEITILTTGTSFQLLFKLTKMSPGKLIDMNYYGIPSDGQILLKLDDNSIIELKRSPGIEETRTYENTFIISSFYTYSSVFVLYDIQDITPLLKHAIKKVRVELNNKDVVDFEITKPKEQKRILQEFNEQYKVVHSRLKTQNHRNEDLRNGF